MESPNVLLVLFSKYSSVCQSLLQLYDEEQHPNIKFVCVDNVHIRKELLVHNIHTVPCALFLYPDKRVEKFEGQNVVQWLREKLTPPRPDTKKEQPYPIPDTKKEHPVPTPNTEPPTDQLMSTTPVSDFIMESSRTGEEFVSASIKQNVKKEKSIVERAAEMAAMREGADKPAHMQMQEQQHKQLEAAVQGRVA